jgi:putative flippase GtrA
MASPGNQIDHRSVRHWGGFLFSGGVAFLIDAGITTLLIRIARLDPFSARLIAILIAMVFAWLMHRRITFNVAYAATVKEFLHFAAVAGSANATNYVVYAAILLIWPATAPIGAILISSAIATVLSYLGFRFGVFRRQATD